MLASGSAAAPLSAEEEDDDEEVVEEEEDDEDDDDAEAVAIEQRAALEAFEQTLSLARLPCLLSTRKFSRSTHRGFTSGP